MPDEKFAEPRLAEIYDDVDPDRRDLDHYVAMATQFGAHSVLDLGCGTGTFACMLAVRGHDVVGVDPAAASLDVARRKPGADSVRWLLGDATTLPALDVDLAAMTGNVAQVFVSDDDWHDTLVGTRRALRPEGRLVFETRDPARRGWEEWNRDDSFARTAIAGVGVVETWVELVDVSLPLVSFRSVFHFERDDETLISTSTLRFRDRDEIDASLRAAGFEPLEIRDAPDRPSREFVVIAKAGSAGGAGREG